MNIATTWFPRSDRREVLCDTCGESTNWPGEEHGYKNEFTCPHCGTVADEFRTRWVGDPRQEHAMQGLNVTIHEVNGLTYINGVQATCVVCYTEKSPVWYITPNGSKFLCEKCRKEVLA